jgi:hypothetical protein
MGVDLWIGWDERAAKEEAEDIEDQIGWQDIC